MPRFKDKVALVTGAAGGVGLAVARAFAAEGACIVLADVQRDKVLAAAAEIQDSGGLATGIVADVNDYDDCVAMVSHAVRTFGALHIAVNNAAVPSVPYGEFEEIELTDWYRVIGTDLTGPLHAMRAEAGPIREAGGGAIINVASMMSFVCQPGMAAYIAAKHGLAGLTKAAAMDLIKHGIRVNAVCPGFVDTPMLAPALAIAEQRAHIEGMVPTSRVARPEEIANAIMFLASADSSYMVGALMRVDGGSTLA